MLFDAHIHLTDPEFSPYIEHVLEGLRKMQICACSVTVDTATSIRGLELFNNEHDIVKQFIGIHPEASAREDLDKFVQLFRDNITRVDGIGEIGLDKTYIERGISFEDQNRVFSKMLELAETTGKPVSVHSRRSLDDILSVLPSYRIKSILFHWFAGSKKQLAKCMEIDNVFASYGPTLLYADDKRNLLKNTDKDRILIETDGPVRYSRCFSDLPAISTSFLVSILAEAAKVLEMSITETESLLENNARGFLLGQR